MPMRQDCRHFESRTYRTGETVRKCDLGLAPEAPWRCPDDCSAYAKRLADVNWSHGTLVTPPTPEAPDAVGRGDGSVAAVLDEARNIVNAAAAEALEDVDRGSSRRGRIRRFLRRSRPEHER